MTRTRGASHQPIFPTFSRRQFVGSVLAAGVLASLPPALTAWGKDQPAKRRKRRVERRTLFFNFAHETDADVATYYLVAAGARHRLRRAQDHPGILKQQRRRNAFLRGVPDSAITHFVQNAELPADSVALTYVVQNPDPTSGTWNMSSMSFILPTGAVLDAHARARALVPDGPLPLSAKRQLYGHPAAESAQDFLDEEALRDTSDHATAIIGMHPDLLSVEPKSAAHVQKNYIATNGFTLELSLLLQAVGAATPQETPNQSNPGGWATLTPILDDNQQPFRNRTGTNKGLIQYHPDWNPTIVPAATSGASAALAPVKDDETLGADATTLDPSAPPPSLTGALWKRHDGFTTVDQSPGAGGAGQDTLAYTLKTLNTESGFSCTGSAASQPNGSVQANLTFKNWYVRWLGVYLLFLDANGNPIDPTGVQIQLPADYDPGDARQTLQEFKALFGFLLGPEFTVMGIPVLASTATMTFTVPAGASSVRIFASGPSTKSAAAPDPSDPTTWGNYIPGMVLTIVINYGLVLLLMAAGASDSLSVIQKAALPLAPAIFTEVFNVLSDVLENKDFSKPDVWKQLATVLGKTFLTVLAGQGTKLLALILLDMALGAAEDNVPIAGQIALGISLLAGTATVLETFVEIGLSPVSYVYDLVLTHDITVQILPDHADDTFPAVANYYKVTALFDNGGTPHVQTLDMPGGTVSTLPPVVFKSVPMGGRVTVSVGFYSRSTDPGQNDWLAGKGTTGLVDNTVDELPDLTIQEFKVPIQSTTVYVHTQKTALDAQGQHQWQGTSAGPTVKQSDIACEGTGTLCSFRSITVRQGTAQAPGYVGYAWQSDSSGVVDCSSGGPGQLDQLANLGDVTPQSGYVTGPCGFQTGAKVAYSLLAHGTANFYLDSTNKLVRQVQLDPTPQFDPPSGQRAWGALNLDSDALLLHPSGRLVSIHKPLSKIEVLQLPTAPLSDDEALSKLVAQVHSGQGSRPGLLDGPSAAAISPDGVLLILEEQNSRIQAFDLGANPVQFFTKQSTPYFLELSETAGGDTVYLDLAVEYTGYLYVLSFDQGTNQYRLDVYHPGQSGTSPISTTLNVNAAKLTVDFWRNVYTLNYELLQLPGGGVPAVTEPSVSLWTPSAP